MPPFPPEVGDFRFLLLYGFLYCLQSSAVVLFGLSDAGSLIRTFARDIKSKLKIMSLKVDSCLPQISEPRWSTDCGSTNRIPVYMYEYELEPIIYNIYGESH